MIRFSQNHRERTMGVFFKYNDQTVDLELYLQLYDLSLIYKTPIDLVTDIEFCYYNLETFYNVLLKEMDNDLYIS